MEHGAYYVHKATAHRTEELYLFTVFWKNTNSFAGIECASWIKKAYCTESRFWSHRLPIRRGLPA